MVELAAKGRGGLAVMEPPAPATHDEELERRVLGALMHTQQTPERLEEALAILARSDFYYHLHRDT
jgi:replicative DNA helicase